MNIIYLIGNGFDLAQGLKTSYPDFYHYLEVQEPINDVEAKMIAQVRGDKYEKWSDLELALGEYTGEVSDKSAFEEFYYDLCDKLRKYLVEQTNKFEPKEGFVEKYVRDLVRPDFYLTTREQQTYGNYVRNYTDVRRISIVSFNYTDVIDRCLDTANSERILPFATYRYQLEPLLKIHGTLGTPYLLMGVNDESQIANPEFAKDEDVQDYLIKPKSNFEIGTRIEEQVSSRIETAHLIIAMGLSFGDTDSTWWKQIGMKLKQTTALYIVVFVHEQELPTDERRIQPIKRRIRRDFLSKCGIEVDVQSFYQDRILICINKGLFSPQTIIFEDERRGI